MRTIGIITVVAALIFVIGLIAGWFTISSNDSGKDTSVGMTVHGDEFEKDVEKAKQKVEEVAGRAKSEVSETLGIDKVLVGTVSVAEPAAQRLVVAAAGHDEPLVVKIEPQAEIRLDGMPATLDRLRAGDGVTVTLRERGDLSTAIRVDATRG